jgi:hypothetical protein
MRSNTKSLEESVISNLHRMNCAVGRGNWPILRFGNYREYLLKEEKMNIAVASLLPGGGGRRMLNEEGILGEGYAEHRPGGRRGQRARRDSMRSCVSRTSSHFRCAKGYSRKTPGSQMIVIWTSARSRAHIRERQGLQATSTAAALRKESRVRFAWRAGRVGYQSPTDTIEMELQSRSTNAPDDVTPSSNIPLLLRYPSFVRDILASQERGGVE